MKIQINGFDIEVNTEEEAMSIKVIDASGKELSNNTYAQTMEGSDDENIENVEVPGVEEVEPTEETEELAETEEVVEEEPVDDTEEEITEEGFIPDFESFKKNLKK